MKSKTLDEPDAEIFSKKLLDRVALSFDGNFPATFLNIFLLHHYKNYAMIYLNSEVLQIINVLQGKIWLMKEIF